MNPALQKTLSLLLLIVIGFLLKSKIKSKEQMKGIKTLILAIALPATIFVALLKVEFNPSLFYLPLFALLINGALFFLIKWGMPWFGLNANSKDGRTVNMLFASLAPGLSCFPFLMEYGTEESLAFAALADVGNKVFVLVILYLIAMKWHFQQQQSEAQSKSSRLKGLVLSLVKEPVNLAIIVALIMLNIGWNIHSLPTFLQDPIQRMSLLMTPMVLMFIGMAVKIDLKQFKTIGILLVFRSALGFLLSGLFLLFFPAGISAALALVLVAFPQSAASFWPFAHMSVISDNEADRKHKTFNVDLALNFLALSLPFSIVVILSISVFPGFFTSASHTLLIGACLLLSLIIPKVLNQIRNKVRAISIPKKKTAESS